VSNLEERDVAPKNAVQLIAFVHAFDVEMEKSSGKESWSERGVNFVEFVDSFVSRSTTTRLFQNASAVAVVLHYSVHLLHLVAFADAKMRVHLWFVPDSLPSVFDFLVMIQEEFKVPPRPSAVAKDFLQQCMTLGMKSQKGEPGDWLSKRFLVIGQAQERGEAAIFQARDGFAKSLGLAFLLFSRHFESGRQNAVAEFVEAFLVRHQAGVGRPSLLIRHPDFLASLEETVEQLSGIIADARVTRGVSFRAHGSNAGARHYAEHLKSHYGIFLARSTVLTYLRPRNITSRAAQRHSKFALQIRPVFDAKATSKLHVNAHYCCSAVKAMVLLAQLPNLRGETFCFSIDSKAHIKTGNNVRATVRPVKAWVPLKKAKHYTVADHDFLALKKYCLILNGFFSIDPFCGSETDFVRRGDVSYITRPWFYCPDSAVQQLDDFLFMLSEIALDPARLEHFLKGRSFLKLVEISDGGPATKPSNSLVRVTAAFVFHVLGLDLLVRRTNSPETSKLNPVERCHSIVSRSLGGTIPHGIGDKEGMFGAAQTVSEKITDPGLSYSGAPISASAWGSDSVSFVPNQLFAFCGATKSQQRAMHAVELEIPEALLLVVDKLGRPRPRSGFTIGNLLGLISDGRHGSCTSVDSTISRCNDSSCQLCGGLWQGKPWVLSANGSLPMPIPGEIPGHYMALPELIVSTVGNGGQASWRPSDLIEEAIHGIAFCRGLHILSLESPAFIEVSVR
jgi:hypothetical protein